MRCFQGFFKKTYNYEIKDEYILGICSILELFDDKGVKYAMALKEIN